MRSGYSESQPAPRACNTAMILDSDSDNEDCTRTCPHSHARKNRHPLRHFSGFLPEAASLTDIDQQLLLRNICALFPDRPGTSLRIAVARTSDAAFNPATGVTETRHLFYAVLVDLGADRTDSAKDDDVTEHAASPVVLAQGCAVPYFAPPPLPPVQIGGRDSHDGGNRMTSSFIGSKSQMVRRPDEGSEVRETKEQALRLLVAKVEQLVHERLGAGLEIWSEAGTWKYGQPRGEPVLSPGGGGRREGSIRSEGKGNSWFSK